MGERPALTLAPLLLGLLASCAAPRVCARAPAQSPEDKALLDAFAAIQTPFHVSTAVRGREPSDCDLVADFRATGTSGARVTVTRARSGKPFSEIEAAGSARRIAQVVAESIKLRLREEPLNP